MLGIIRKNMIINYMMRILMKANGYLEECQISVTSTAHSGSLDLAATKRRSTDGLTFLIGTVPGVSHTQGNDARGEVGRQPPYRW